MSYLELSNPTTNSCDYEVYLSSPFNQDYYIQIRITSTDYGASTSDVSNYVVYKDAPSSGTSRYVRGVVDDGMSAGRRYTLYAYAQAANGTWYLAGEDSIRTLENDGETYDYGFTNVEIKTAEPYNIGDEIKITATVKNYKRSIGPSYIVELRDKNGDLLDEDSENPLDGKDTNNAYLYPVLSEDHIENGVIQYTLRIVADESGWVEADSDDNTEIIEVPISIDGNDDFSYATPLSFDEIITGTIDQDNDQDYYLLDDIPSDCEAFMVVLDYNDVPHEGDYDCDIYVYDENEDKISLTNGITAGTTYVKVPVTGNKYYIRIDLDGDFISSKDQKYRLYVTDIPVSYVEEANDISEASEIHEGMNILGNLRNSEDHYYTITPTVSRKLRFVVQTDSRDNDYSIILFDSNEDVLYRDSGSSPVMAEYDLEEGSQYFIKVSPEENTTIDNSTYLLYVEVEGVGGAFVPIKTVTFGLDENGTKDYSFSGTALHKYLISFDKPGEATFSLERTSGDFVGIMELFEVGSMNLYPSKMLVDTNTISITTGVNSTSLYRLSITCLSGVGNYTVRCSYSSRGSQYIEKLKNDTSLGLDSDKKNTLIGAATALFESDSNFELPFIAGLLGNILYEAKLGQFENSNYESHPEQKPSYLTEVENLETFDYKNRFSNKYLHKKVGGIQPTLKETKELIDACAATGYAAKFGLGCVQWTGSRTMNLVNHYIDLFGINADLVESDCLKAESTFMLIELTGEYSWIYDEWYDSYYNSANSAYEAGKIICLKYEIPANKDSASSIRANASQKIYEIFIG